jgi:hypothetical protein
MKLELTLGKYEFLIENMQYIQNRGIVLLTRSPVKCHNNREDFLEAIEAPNDRQVLGLEAFAISHIYEGSPIGLMIDPELLEQADEEA